MNSLTRSKPNLRPNSKFRLGWKTILKASLLAIILLATVEFAGAATIHGTVYSWETLEPLPKTEIIINTTPEQHMISEDGKYQINLSKGTYSLEGVYYRDGSVEMYAQKNITIEQEGDYKIDLVLFPPLSDISPEAPEDLNFSVDDENETEEVSESDGGGGGDGDGLNLLIPFVIVFCLVAAASAFIIVKKKRFGPEENGLSKSEPEGEPEIAKAPSELSEKSVGPEDIPEDLQEALSIIKKEGGRITQKNLRKKMGYSEAKMSLVIADLERRNIVEKVKKGRGNIIFLKNSENQ